MVAALEEYLLAADPRPDPVVADVRALVAQAEEDRSLTRAEQLAERASTSLRSLQRLFTDYVGIGPKWVVARFRILDAAAAAHGGDLVDWAALATELGFTDQAHLTRAFTAVVGTPPATYARQA
jgi:transcriptional regulator GlxA family with amidase domain